MTLWLPCQLFTRIASDCIWLFVVNLSRNKFTISLAFLSALSLNKIWLWYYFISQTLPHDKTLVFKQSLLGRMTCWNVDCSLIWEYPSEQFIYLCEYNYFPVLMHTNATEHEAVENQICHHFECLIHNKKPDVICT